MLRRPFFLERLQNCNLAGEPFPRAGLCLLQAAAPCQALRPPGQRVLLAPRAQPGQLLPPLLSQKF